MEQMVFETRNRHIFLMLFALGKMPSAIRYEERGIYYQFEQEDVPRIVQQYMAGEPVMVDIHAFYRGEDFFKSHLNARQVDHR